jgi:rubrerythrin
MSEQGWNSYNCPKCGSLHKEDVCPKCNTPLSEEEKRRINRKIISDFLEDELVS